jgi:hypothetical protein
VSLFIIIMAVARRIIAVCGKKQSGKDTIANMLVHRHGFVNLKLAQPIKDVVKTLFALTDEEVNGSEKEKIHPFWKVTPRTLMQFFGTELFQYEIQRILPHIGRDFWLHKLHNDMVHEYATKNIVISDLRFAHEYTYLKQHFPNMTVFRVHRPSSDLSGDTHSSETELDHIPYDAVFYNTSTVSRLHEEVNSHLSQTK